MSHLAPWRLLIHDPDRGDPKFILCTVAAPGDVRPTTLDATVDEATVRWVAARHGVDHLELTPLPHAAVWHVDDGGNPR